jgi:2-polyprenyl-3-methyl-5-hydroxy-6-metoxy-1,4-benzoquinol methylase
MPDCAGKRVLDLRCGHGALSVDLAQAGGQVTGIDLDAERIAFATANVREQPAVGGRGSSRPLRR